MILTSTNTPSQKLVVLKYSVKRKARLPIRKPWLGLTEDPRSFTSGISFLLMCTNFLWPNIHIFIQTYKLNRKYGSYSLARTLAQLQFY